MTAEMTAGTFTAIFNRLSMKTQASGAAALTQIALAVERQTKLDLAQKTHQYGTKTPAARGGPPALVSGTLRRSVTHTRPSTHTFGWEVRVGLATGFYPPYPKKGRRTMSSKYGYYLERVHGFTFLEPAFRHVIAAGAAATVGRMMAAEWDKP